MLKSELIKKLQSIEGEFQVKVPQEQTVIDQSVDFTGDLEFRSDEGILYINGAE